MEKRSQGKSSDNEIEVTADVQAAEVAHMRWMDENGFDESKNFLRMAHFPILGRGLVTTAPLQDGDMMMEISGAFILYSTNLHIHNMAQLQRALDENPEFREDKQLLCAIVILHEYFYPQSFWAPFFRLIPKSVTVAEMWEKEARKAVEGTLLFGEMLRYSKQSLSRTYHDKLVPFFKNYPEVFDGRVYTKEEYRWAQAIANSRSFDFSNIFGEYVLVPYADLFNHCCDNGGDTEKNRVATYTYTMDTDIFRVYASKDYSEGEQVYITYGEKSNSQFLISYGFMFANNIADTIDLTAIHFPQVDDFMSKYCSNNSTNGEEKSSASQSPYDTLAMKEEHVTSLKNMVLKDIYFELKMDKETGKPLLQPSFLNFVRVHIMTPEERAALNSADRLVTSNPGSENASPQVKAEEQEKNEKATTKKAKTKTKTKDAAKQIFGSGQHTNSHRKKKKKNRKHKNTKRKNRNRNHNNRQNNTQLELTQKHFFVSADNERRAHTYVLAILDNIISKFSTSIEEDEALLQTNELTFNMRMAIMFRQEEKKRIIQFKQGYLRHYEGLLGSNTQEVLQ